MKNADCVKGKRKQSSNAPKAACMWWGMSCKYYYIELDWGKRVDARIRLWFECSETEQEVKNQNRLWRTSKRLTLGTTTWILDDGRQGRSSNGRSWQSHTIPSSCWTLSGKPDIVFLRLTFLGRRARVSVFIRERRMLAWRSNVCPGDQVRRAGVESRQAVNDEHAFFFMQTIRICNNEHIQCTRQLKKWKKTKYQPLSGAD